MKIKKIIAVILSGAMLFGLCACDFSFFNTNSDKSDEAATGGIAVQVQEVTISDIATESKVSGKVVSSAENSIYVPGTVKVSAVYKSAGSKVQAGDKICRLDMSTLVEENADAESENQALDQLSLLNKQVDLAKTSFEAAKALYAIGAASQVEVDTAEIQYLTAKMQLDSTLSQLSSTLQAVSSGTTVKNYASENIDEEGNVIAPEDGTLVSITAVTGSYVSASYPLAVIQSGQKPVVSVSVSEALIGKLTVGDEVLIHFDSLGQDVTGSIRSVDQSSSLQTKLYGVMISIPDSVSGIISGMFADVTFYTDASENAVTIPSESILNGDDGSYVYIIENDTAKYVKIETGLTSGGLTEVTSGLEAGDLLVTVGQSYLKDGESVRVVAQEE